MSEANKSILVWGLYLALIVIAFALAERISGKYEQPTVKEVKK